MACPAAAGHYVGSTTSSRIISTQSGASMAILAVLLSKSMMVMVIPSRIRSPSSSTCSGLIVNLSPCASFLVSTSLPTVRSLIGGSQERVDRMPQDASSGNILLSKRGASLPPCTINRRSRRLIAPAYYGSAHRRFPNDRNGSEGRR